MLAGCHVLAGQACPYQGKPDYAPSAGCLAVVHGKILVVESRKGGLTPPGGKSRPGESAQCAAHRETLEETGLDLMPQQLLAVFDTGFHLYYGDIHADSGTIAPRLGEVKRSFWLDIADFGTVKWRFAGQGAALLEVLERGLPSPPVRPGVAERER